MSASHRGAAAPVCLGLVLATAGCAADTRGPTEERIPSAPWAFDGGPSVPVLDAGGLGPRGGDAGPERDGGVQALPGAFVARLASAPSIDGGITAPGADAGSPAPPPADDGPPAPAPPPPPSEGAIPPNPMPTDPGPGEGAIPPNPMPTRPPGAIPPNPMPTDGDGTTSG